MKIIKTERVREDASDDSEDGEEDDDELPCVIDKLDAEINEDPHTQSNQSTPAEPLVSGLTFTLLPCSALCGQTLRTTYVPFKQLFRADLRTDYCQQSSC